MTKPVVISSPNPRILRALQKQEITVNNLAPVDTNNANIPSTDSLPFLPNPKKRSGPINIGKLKLSYQLRYLFKALLQWKETRADHKIMFATVLFSRVTEDKLNKAKKGPVSAYGDRLSKAFKNLDNETNFFFTLEKGKSLNKRLHAHILIAYHPDDFDTLEALLKKDAINTGSGVKTQHHYILKHPAKPGSAEYEILELDEEHGLCSYKKDENGNYYKKLPIDVGAADYISKDLSKGCLGKSKRRYYATRSLTQLSNELWKEGYELQKKVIASK